MKRFILGVAAGLVVGVVVSALAGWALLPGMMIVTAPSRLGFDETVAAIQKAIPEHGWASPATIDLNKSMAKKGVAFRPRVKVVQMCHPQYAKQVLTTDRYVASLMPCAVAVYEGDDGRVYVSKMNTGLMGRLFGGTIAKVMGGAVARDEAAMLEDAVGP